MTSCSARGAGGSPGTPPASHLRHLLFRSVGREFLKHFLHALIEILDVLVGVVGQRVARAASPEELLRLGVEQIDDQRAYLICIRGGRCLSEASASKSSPTPASSEPVIEGIQGL